MVSGGKLFWLSIDWKEMGGISVCRPIGNRWFGKALSL